MFKLNQLKYQGFLGFQLACLLRYVYYLKNGALMDDKSYLKKRFLNVQDYKLNLENPKTLNEKLHALKFVYNKDLHKTVSDKFAVRKFLIERFGEEHIIPLVLETTNPQKLTADNFPDFPVIVKANHDAGNYTIIRFKKDVNWEKLRTDAKWWLKWNYYYADREQQYKTIERRIIVEKLLLTKDGNIPNDYKLNYVNGKLEFVYVSVDRENGNFRNIYDTDWQPLYFKWASKSKMDKTKRGPEISEPLSFSKMKKLGGEIAKLFPYVRVDFYDVDGKLYFGEITLCHGGGFDKMLPIEKDLEYGQKLIIN